MLTHESFSFNDNPVTFRADHFVNASEMAKPFGKQPAHFLRLKQTQSFMLALQYANSHSEVVRVENGGKNPGTWMHEKLALKFAAWLSPEFELWVFDRIQELLLRGQVSIASTSDADRIEELERRLDDLATREEVRALKFAASIQAREAAFDSPFTHNYYMSLSKKYLEEASSPSAGSFG